MNARAKTSENGSSQGAAEIVVPEEERGRAEMYRLLSVLLARAPDAGMHQLLSELEPDDSLLGNALGSLSAVARSRSLEALRDEYDALFLGMPTPRVMPYASYYVNGQLFGRSLAELRMRLAKLGVARKANATEPEDHIAILFEIMSGLIVGAFGSGPLPLDEQRAFFRVHIAPWAAKCFGELEASDASAFYMAVGHLGRAFLAMETDAFVMVPEHA